MRRVLLLCLLVASALSENEDAVVKPVFTPPARPNADIYFFETFSDPEAFEARWVESQATKDGVDADIAKYDGEWAVESQTVGGFEEDKGLVMKSTAKHYAISAKLERPFEFDEHLLAVQYEVNFQEGMSCGGAYVKLLSQTDSLDLEQFHEKTPYTIMFGPDKCGTSSKVHFIFRHKNPVTGEYEEKHAKAVDTDMGFFDDKKTHVFRLVVKPDNTYDILIDSLVVSSGSLLEDFSPPVNPPKEIDDPDDKKPEDWDEKEKIPDPTAVKPDDWDEDAPAKIADPDAVKPEGWLDDGPEYVPDPDASQPDDWDEEEDGEWEAPTIPNPACEEVGCGEWKPPMIANPAYKGKWSAPLIDNPLYQGIWEPRRIPNPAYFEDKDPFKMTSINAIGLELWTMSKDVHFDNFIITTELTAASTVAVDGWRRKMEHERDSDPSNNLGPFLEWFVSAANERPYLWLLYILVLVMPFVLCAACCVRSPKPPQATPAEDAQHKKTDDVVPDDKEEVQETGPEESFIGSAEDEEEELKRKTGTDPEPQDGSAPSSRPESQLSTNEDKSPAPEEDLIEDEPEKPPAEDSEKPQKPDEEDITEATSSPGKTTRKRKPRRET